jgi:hypothetical protein
LLEYLFKFYRGWVTFKYENVCTYKIMISTLNKLMLLWATNYIVLL